MQKSGRSQFEASPGQIVHETLSKIPNTKTGVEAQVVYCLAGIRP
jgi:hypothetical protein